MPDFYAILEEIHRKQGVALQRDPIVGGQRIDLQKIYNLVQEEGGYEKV